MPGVVTTLAVTVGDTVRMGDFLLTLEAMKMETAITASRDGIIREVSVVTGATVDAKDLLLIID